MTIRDTSAPVLVLRSDSHGGLNIMKSLGPLGANVFNLDPQRSASAHHSRYCRGSFIWDIEHAPAESSLAFLRAARDKIGRKAILIPTSDVTTCCAERRSHSAQQAAEPIILPGDGHMTRTAN